MNDCELCRFNNPKATATAIILKDNKILLLKRNEEPFKGLWDLPGGYLNHEETPEAAMAREAEEELGIKPQGIHFMRSQPGTAFWKGKSFPVVSSFYLVDIGNQEIRLNGENSAYDWINLRDVKSDIVAFDSNRFFMRWLKTNFTFDIERIKGLVSQLDSRATVHEQSLYKAALCGYVSTEYDGDKLIGIGWIFPRQTLLRHQAVIEDMIVDESYRGRGYGEKILYELFNWAKNKGVEVVELTTNSKRVAAHKLYEKFGFKIHETDHMLLDMTMRS